MKHIMKELCRLSARMAAIEQKCDLILSELSAMRAHDGLDEMIDRLHRQARAMREEARHRR